MSIRRPLVLALSLAGLVMLGLYAWQASRTSAMPVRVGGGAASAAAQPGAARAVGAAVAVEVQPVRAQPMADDVTAVGSLVSNESVVLRPEVAGRIAEIGFRDGAPVRKGAVLVAFDAAVQRAELQQAQASLNLAVANHRRAEDLFARKFFSQSGLDTAQSQLEAARASVALAQARFERTRIRAPFDGIAGIRKVSVGDYIKDGEALVNVEDVATLKLDFRLPELYLGRLQVGQRLEVTSDVLPGERFDATLDAIDPLVDAQGRAVQLRARLANSGNRLRPGVFVRVRLILEARPAVPVVPEEALVAAPGNVQFVYRVDDGRAKRVDVLTGARRAGMVELVEGPAVGDTVVTAGQLKLRDGAAVSIVPVAAVAAAGTD
ncbi:efflux transporter periplasmic adaptor subunit [Parazoarcus communis]|uniref:Efflux transporter periplasmic adaptor subunit n=1 Tax=Parazoarcus communis TaxID=41977 RepID=A0A2U8GWN6_9RHOO|nr:efflux RND transporter periplasmic adaptor subunit [Parazoarcus communis]AWI78011.1 efflux transporter periplasmic adaptor subunit [Parazoarcus communis]